VNYRGRVDQGPTIEILDDGRPPPRRPSGADRLEDWAPGRRARAWVRAHRGVAVLAGAAVLAVAGVVAVRLMPGPPPPPVDVSALVSTDGPDESWQPGADGRPSGVAVDVIAAVQRSASTRTGRAARQPVTVLGLSGPGVVADEASPQDLPADGTVVRLPLSPSVDCLRVPATVPEGAYGLRVRAGRTGPVQVVPGPVGDQPLASRVQAACSTWHARRDLTVTAASVVVDPVRPHVDATLTVTNTGDREATLARTPVSSRPDVVLPQRVPPHGSVVVPLPIDVHNCGYTIGWSGGSTPPDSGSLGGLWAWSGPLPAREGPGAGFATGSGPTGMVLAPAAEAPLEAGMNRACGGLGPVVLLTRSTRYDRRTRVLTADVAVDLTPGLVSAVTLQPVAPDPQDGTPSAIDARALWSRTGPLTPDRSGQVRLTLRYLLPTVDCADGRTGSFPQVDLRISVPDAGRVRDLDDTLMIELGDDPAVRAFTCGLGG